MEPFLAHKGSLVHFFFLTQNNQVDADKLLHHQIILKLKYYLIVVLFLPDICDNFLLKKKKIIMKTLVVFVVAIVAVTQAISFFDLVMEEWGTFKVLCIPK